MSRVMQTEQRVDLNSTTNRENRLALLGQSYAALAHQIRNPLTIAGLYAELLESRCEGDPEALKAVAGINANLEKIEDYVRNAMIFVRGELQSRRMFTVEDLLERIRNSCSAFMKPEEYRCVGFEGVNGMLSGDLNALVSAFENLLENSIQSVKGPIRLVITATRRKGSLVLSFCDNGPGIPAGLKAMVTQPFVSGRKEGTGLGLAIVESVIHAHKGCFSLSSPECGGTRATVRLPLDLPEKVRAKKKGGGFGE